MTNMSLRFFNTYSRELEEFQPRDAAERKIGIYTCGPTVYSRAHIGNFRAYIFEDLLQRHLELRGNKVHRVMNITDVDDKTIRGAREAKIPLAKFTVQFKKAFFEDIGTLRIKRADEFPAATDKRYVERMIKMIGVLISRGLAYQADDKSVYFRINKFPDYGKLAHFRNVRRNFRRFGKNGCVHIDRSRFVLRQKRLYMSQNVDAADAAN